MTNWPRPLQLFCFKSPHKSSSLSRECISNLPGRCQLLCVVRVNNTLVCALNAQHVAQSYKYLCSYTTARPKTMYISGKFHQSGCIYNIRIIMTWIKFITKEFLDKPLAKPVGLLKIKAVVELLFGACGIW